VTVVHGVAKTEVITVYDYDVAVKAANNQFKSQVPHTAEWHDIGCLC